MEYVSGYKAGQGQDAMDIRKGAWSPEEDQQLFNYINKYGSGRWNTLACCAGLKRTGKSCRLRWLNYLRPDVRRGNITFQEQLLILQLHSQWGNRWSKIAQYLPGRTDNEIKNYWRTRVQKQAKQLKCEVNSQQFRDAMRCVWIPRLTERIQAQSESLNHHQRVVVSSSEVCCGGYASTATSCDSSETSARIFTDSGVSTGAYSTRGTTQYRSVCGPEFEANGRNDYSVGGASVESSAWSDGDICYDDLDVLLGFELPGDYK